MKNSMKAAVLMLATVAKSQAVDVFGEPDLDALMNQMKQQIEQVHAHFEEFEKMNQRNLQFKNEGVSLSTSETGNEVKVVAKLPKLQSETTDSRVEIEADGGALDGSLSYGGHQVRIIVTDGQILRLTHKYAVQEEDVQQDKKASKRMSISSNQSVVLPVQVGKLENTKAEFKDGELVLHLPKAEAVSRGWSKIVVQKS